jgi:hypothetical protein
MRPNPTRLGAAATCIAAGLLAACAATPWWHAELDTWIGAPTTELLDAWGPPLRIMSNADGSTLLVFERTRSLDPRIEQLANPGAALDPNRSRQALSAPRQSDCMLFFEISDDAVTAVRHEGQACNIVPRDPTRRRSDPATGRQR